MKLTNLRDIVDRDIWMVTRNEAVHKTVRRGTNEKLFIFDSICIMIWREIRSV